MNWKAWRRKFTRSRQKWRASKACLPIPEFFRKHAAQVNQLKNELEAAKENVAKLYARWEELEGVKLAAERL